MRDEPVATDLLVACLGAALSASPAIFLSILLLFAWPALAEEAETEVFSALQLEFFENEVRPILAARCYECHGPDVAEPKGGLRLDSRESLLAGGDTGAAIVPGDATGSLLIDTVNYGDIYQMPPKSKMPAEEIAVLTKWVTSGAPWPRGEGARPAIRHDEFSLAERRDSHWAWKPIAEASVPKLAMASGWPRGPIDQFILAKLEEHDLSPAPEADPSSLLRRLHFDLTGLPPSPEEAESFLSLDEQDRRAEYERSVDRLLASPAFAERFARHWLDLVRYAETRGHEFDYDSANVWHYRDYCVRAIDADLPYDQFVIEHIAGDLVAPARRNPSQGYNESVLATGFWHLGEWIHSPVDIRQDETDRFDNMVDVFSKTFLGLTVACARCHDHKFDAISQADYYALTGYLQSSEYRQARFDTMEQHREVAAELAALEDQWRPKISSQLGEILTARLDRAEDYLQAAGEVLGGASIREAAAPANLSLERLEKWTAALHLAIDDASAPLHPFALAARQGKDESIGAVLAAFLVNPPSVAEPRQTILDYTAKRDAYFAADGPTFGGAAIPAGQWLAPPTADSKSIAFAEYGAARRDGRWKPLRLAAGVQGEAGKLAGVDRAGKTLRSPTFTLQGGDLYYLVRGAGYAYAVVDSHRMVNGPLHGELWLEFDHGAKPTWVRHPLATYAGHEAHVEFIARREDDLEILQVIEASEPPAEFQPAGSLQKQMLRRAGGSLAQLAAAYAALLRETADLVASGKLAEANEPGERARIANWLLRSDLAEKDGETLATTLTAFDETQRAILSKVIWESRTAIAMWDGDGIDDRLLIRGNVKTPGPSVERGMLEAIAGPRGACDASGSGRLELAQRLVSPENPFVSRVMVNRLWHHLFGRGLVPSVDNFGVLGQPPTHGELLDYLASQFMRDGWSVKRMVREMALSSAYAMSSGASSQDFADPSNQLLHRARLRRLEAEPIRDSLLSVSGRLDRRRFGSSTLIHLTPFLQGRGRPGGSGPIDGDGRRSLYLSTRRNFLSPMMLAFDAPIPLGTVGKRNVSNVPAQALILLNDPLVIEQARLWARRVLAGGERSLESRLNEMYLTAFSRRALPAEIASAEAFLQSQGRQYGLTTKEAARDERVWTDLCHVLFNTKEFIFLN